MIPREVEALYTNGPSGGGEVWSDNCDWLYIDTPGNGATQN